MAFYLLEARLPPLFSLDLFLRTSFLARRNIEKWPAAWKVRSTVVNRAYQKVIDTELLDDCFLVTLAEDVAVDHPGSRSAADRALDDVHRLLPQR